MLASTALLVVLMSAWCLAALQKAAELRVAAFGADRTKDRKVAAEAAKLIVDIATCWMVFLSLGAVAMTVAGWVRVADGDLRVLSALTISGLTGGSIGLALFSLPKLYAEIKKIEAP